MKFAREKIAIVLFLIALNRRSLAQQQISDWYDKCSDDDTNCIGWHIDTKQEAACLTSRDCSLAFSYRGVDEDRYEFNLLAKNVSQDWPFTIDVNDYVAVGLQNEAVQPGMKLALVAACYIFDPDPDNGSNVVTPVAEMYYNIPPDDPGAYPPSYPVKLDVSYAQTISNLSISAVDDHIMCRLLN